jgi:hypothetical protein
MDYMSIAGQVSSMSNAQQVELLTNFQSFAQQHPAEAQKLLVDTPVLAQTLLQVELMYGLITTRDIRDSVSAGVAAAAAPSPQQQQQRQQQQAASTTSRTGNAAASAAAAAPKPMAPISGLNAQQMVKIQQLLAMTPAEIAKLPPLQQQQISALRAQVARQSGGGGQSGGGVKR